MMVTNAVYKTHGKHISHKRAAAIADKRQRYPCNWQDLNRHADILKDMKGNHANNARTNVGIKRVLSVQWSLD